MNKSLRYFLYGLGAIVVLVIIGFALFMNIPKVSAKGQSADFSYSADQLYQEYKFNERNGDKKFIGKVIEVTGTISEISKDNQGALVILLSADDALGGVLGTLEMSEAEKAAHLKLGKTVTLKGICSGMIMEVVLNRCTLIAQK